MNPGGTCETLSFILSIQSSSKVGSELSCLLERSVLSRVAVARAVDGNSPVESAADATIGHIAVTMPAIDKQMHVLVTLTNPEE